MEIKIVKIENPDNLNLILGQSHFIKTVEDIYEAMISTVPMAKFGLAFCEASDVCLVRHTGTDEELRELAHKGGTAREFHGRFRGPHRDGSESHHQYHDHCCAQLSPVHVFASRILSVATAPRTHGPGAGWLKS